MSSSIRNRLRGTIELLHPQPSLVAWFVVMPIKDLGPAGGWDPKIIIDRLLLNGAWGLGVGFIMRLLNRVIFA